MKDSALKTPVIWYAGRITGGVIYVEGPNCSGGYESSEELAKECNYNSYTFLPKAAGKRKGTIYEAPKRIVLKKKIKILQLTDIR